MGYSGWGVKSKRFWLGIQGGVLLCDCVKTKNYCAENLIQKQNKNKNKLDLHVVAFSQKI